MRIALLEAPNWNGWSRDQTRFESVARLLANHGHEVLLVVARHPAIAPAINLV